MKKHTLQIIVKEENEYHLLLETVDDKKTVEDKILSGEIPLVDIDKTTITVKYITDSRKLSI
jgi:hypothetical protein